MKVLVVCKYKEGFPDHAAPFVIEQRNALQHCGVECDLFLVEGKGIHGYLKQLSLLKKRIAIFHPDVIHAHYGLSGLLANLQRKIPVVTTYHGTDINDPKVSRLSKMAMKFSSWNIFVSRDIIEKTKLRENASLLPCGVDLSELQQTEKLEARKRLCLSPNGKYVLFAGAFDNMVKNAPLAKKVIACLYDDTVELLELKGYSRNEVTLLMCAADVLLMTSYSEGSPQVIKEALACGCPIVSVAVGDVKERVDGVEGCFVAKTREPLELIELLRKALRYEGRIKGREKIVADRLDNLDVANKLIEIYSKIV